MVIYLFFGRESRVSPLNFLLEISGALFYVFWGYLHKYKFRKLSWAVTQKFFRTFHFSVFDHPCTIFFPERDLGVLKPFKRIDVCFCYSAYFCLIRGSGQDCRPLKFFRIIHAFGVFYRLSIISCFLNGFKLLSRKKMKTCICFDVFYKSCKLIYLGFWILGYALVIRPQLLNDVDTAFQFSLNTAMLIIREYVNVADAAK